MNGKGLYAWKFINIEGGDPARIAAKAKELGVSWIAAKLADGYSNYNISVDLGAIFHALRAAGISVWGWQYIYGGSPSAEAAKAIERIKQFSVDGFIIDAEEEFKVDGMGPKATAYMQALRAGVGDKFPLALSTYRYPSIHRPFPFREFLNYCNINMPQVYWLLRHDPAAQIDRCISEYKALGWNGPTIPAGSAYAEETWSPTAGDITQFLTHSRDLGLPGAFFWEWSSAYKLPEVWQAIKAFNWALPQPVEPDYAAQIAELETKYKSLLTTAGNLTGDIKALQSAYAAQADTLAERGAQIETIKATHDKDVADLMTHLGNHEQRIAVLEGGWFRRTEPGIEPLPLEPGPGLPKPRPVAE